LAACQRVPQPPPGAPESEPRAGLRGVPYEVEIAGDGLDAELRARIEAVADTVRGRDLPPANALLLRRRAEDDVARITQLLQAEGYYAGHVRAEVRPAERPEGVYRVRLEVIPGPRYVFGEMRIEVEDESGFQPPPPRRLGLEPGAPARADVVLEAERQLLERARAEGHAFAALGRRRLVVDHERHTMDVVLRIRPGPKAAFAEPVIEGLDGTVDEAFVRRRLGIRAGERFDPRVLQAARERLVATGLFSVVRVRTGTEPDAQGQVPVGVELVPRPFRSVGGAVGFQTDEGPRGRLFWEHRNLFGSGERIRTEAVASRPLQQATVSFRKPDFGRLDRDLTAFLEIRREHTATYDSRSIAPSVGISQPLAEGWQGSIGLGLRGSRVEEKGKKRTFALLSLPLAVEADRSDQLLDPARGWRLRAEIAPFADLRGAGRRFLRLRLNHARYLRLSRDPRIVLAVRGAFGTILGDRREEVPADERFYAGGGGSVRGIPFRRAGPLDANHDPLGGRSLVEGSVELRWRATATVGLVAFLDAGSTYTAVVPDFDPRPRVGAGVGLRYVTPVGPLRLDIAVPVDRKPSVDDLFQVYIGIGQAF